MINKKISAFFGLMSVVGLASAGSETVKSVTFDYDANAAKQTVFQVKQVNGQLTLQNSNVNMKLGGGRVICEKKYNPLGSALYLGPVNSGGTVNQSQNYAMDDTVNIDKYTDGDVIESGFPPLIFDLNINSKVKNYFDPVAIVEQEKQKAVQNGHNALVFLSNDHEFIVKRTVVLLASCRHQNPNKYNQAGYELVSKSVDFKIKYTGTPMPKPIVPTPGSKFAPIKAGTVSGANEINMPYGVSISGGELSALGGNFTGQCPKNVSFKGQLAIQGKGKVQLNIKRWGPEYDSPMSVYTSPQLDYNGGNFQHFFQIQAEKFNKPLGEKQNFTLSMHVRTQGKPTDPWSDYTNIDSLQWSQTCVQRAGIQAIGGVGGIQQQGNGPKPQRMSTVIDVTSGQITSATPNFVGICPKDVLFQTTVSGTGNGKIQLNVKRSGVSVYTSPQLTFNGNLNHNLKIKAEKHNKPLNVKQQFTVSLYARTQDKPSEPWSDYELVDGYIWSQTCSQGASMMRAPVTQSPKPARAGSTTIQVKPSGPQPVTPMKIQAVPVEPQSQPKRAQ